MALIEAVHLKKSFAAITAVDDVSFSVEAGEIYGLVGSDGAGKTTTLRLLVGAFKPDHGEVNVAGCNVLTQTEAARSQIGYLSQRFSLYEDLTVLENIRFFSEVRGLDQKIWKSRCGELLSFVGLAEYKDRKAGQLSGGMKQKLGLASALVTQPKVLLLDEPTTGVDPVTRQDFWQLIIRIVSQEHIAVMLTTPYMDEAARCTRLGFMRAGKIIAEGTPSQLRANLEGCIIEVQCSAPLKIREEVLKVPGVQDARAFGDKLHLRAAREETEKILGSLNLMVAESGGVMNSARLISPSLEDVFISLSRSDEADA
jgi:ABC-2 type transport system ATP-binding protein